MKLQLLRKYDALSEMSREIGLVFFATMFLAPLVSNEYSTGSLIVGLLLAVTAWYFSLSIARK